MLTDVTAQTRATSFADGIVRPLAKSLPLVCAGLKTPIAVKLRVSSACVSVFMEPVTSDLELLAALRAGAMRNYYLCFSASTHRRSKT